MRPYYFAKNFLNKGWEISIFTPKFFNLLFNDSFLEKLENIKYKYIFSLDLQMLKNIVLPKKNSIKLNVKSSNTFIKERFFFKKLKSSFPLNIMYEGGFLYIIYGVIYGIFYTKKNNIKYIYSTYSPYSNHLIAYFIKLFYKDCYWVADFRDLPFGENDTEIYFKSFQSKLNSLICKKADFLITISEGMKNSLLKYNKKICVLNNGLDINLGKLKYYKSSIKENFDIVYTGMLYEGRRDGSSFFKSIKLLIDKGKLPNNLKLIYAGNDSYLWKKWALENGLNDYIDIRGNVTRKESITLQNNATINLLLTWATEKEKGILTGKLFEYLATFNPIICIINGIKDEEIENLFKKINCGCVFYSNEIEEITKNIENFSNNDIKYTYDFNELKKLTYPYLSNELEKIFLENK